LSEQRDPGPKNQDGPKHQQDADGRQLQSDQEPRRHKNLINGIERYVGPLG
jgi:hypothetical protein